MESCSFAWVAQLGVGGPGQCSPKCGWWTKAPTSPRGLSEIQNLGTHPPLTYQIRIYTLTRNTRNKTEKAPVLPWGPRKTTGEPDAKQGIASGMGHKTTLTWTGWHPHLSGTVAGKTYPDEKKKRYLLSFALHLFAQAHKPIGHFVL